MGAHYLVLVVPRLNLEVRRWRARAQAIPDPDLRDAALDALAQKRLHLDGAALFATVVPGHEPVLVRLLVAYQILWDYLDSITEWPAPDQVESGRLLHRAVAEALAPGAAISDHYALHRRHDDGGYLHALVETCRDVCEALPAYARVRDEVLYAAGRGEIQALNHDTRPARRAATLRRWAADELPSHPELDWFELAAAAANNLHIHVLLALAADPRTDRADAARAAAAYFPWASAATTMLDSLVDRGEDAARGDHSYVGYYATDAALAERLHLIVRRSAEAARSLPRGERHDVIVAGMATMYLSKPTAWEPDVCRTSHALVAAAGRAARVMLPVLRLWRGRRESTGASFVNTKN